MMAERETGAKLRDWRHGAGLSEAKAAELVGCTQRTWHDWEAKGKTPEVDFAEAIERVTGGIVSIRDWVMSRRRKRARDRAKSA